jgi:hypothetical protein
MELWIEVLGSQYAFRKSVRLWERERERERESIVVGTFYSVYGTYNIDCELDI